MLTQIRSWLYKLARVLGDWNALRKGKIVKRWLRRRAGHQTQRGLQRFFEPQKKRRPKKR